MSILSVGDGDHGDDDHSLVLLHRISTYSKERNTNKHVCVLCL